MTDTHLAFSIRRSRLENGIWIPKFYDPDLKEDLRVASKSYDLPRLDELLEEGAAGSRLGVWIEREEYGGGDIPYVRTSDLTHWRIRPDFKKGVSEEVYNRNKEKVDIKPGDLLMVAHGTYLVGNVAIVAPGEERLVLQDHVFRLRLRKGAPVDAYFLLAALSTSFIRRQVRARQFSADIIDKIGERHLTLRIPIPKESAIVAAVSAQVKRIIQGQTTVRSELRELLQSDLRMLRERDEARFGFSVRSSRIHQRILIPKYYDPTLDADIRAAERETKKAWVSLGELADRGVLSIDGGVEVGKMAYGTGDIPFVRTSDLVDLELKRDVRHGVSREVYDEYAPKGTLDCDDIVLVRDGTYLVGSSAIVTREDLPALYCGGILRIRVLERNILSPMTLLGLLNAPITRRQMRARQFTRDVIDTLGHRLREVRIPSPDDRRAVLIGRQLQTVIDRKESFKREIRETIRAIEPDIPRTAKGRPGWSMR